MKVSSLSGAATAPRNAMLQMLTQTASGAAPDGARSPVALPAAIAPPPPRSSSFGGADPRAMFEALVQKFDSDGDGKLSLGEVNALNQGGLLARNFAGIDSNSDGALTGDEIAVQSPWLGGRPPFADHGGAVPGADVRPLFDKLTDHLNNNRDAAISAQDLTASRSADFVSDFAKADGQPLPQVLAGLIPMADGNTANAPGSVTLMQSMVMARSGIATTDDESSRPNAARQIYSLR